MTKELSLKEALLAEFGENEPIILRYIDSEEKYGVDKNSFRKYLSNLYKLKEINRAEEGIYYFAFTNTYLNEESFLSDDKLVVSKFIMSGKKRYGYRTGLSFANQLSVTTQVPKMTEITSSMISRNKVENLSTKYFIYKARAKITNSNYRLMQILDLINDYENMVEVEDNKAQEMMTLYLKNTKISRAELNSLINEYPSKLFRTLYNKNLFKVIESTVK
ncbi:hypothetical protein I6N95_15435 [Vagococcus sp. BWB3-3]|uniref:Uncharacterized protein n=1 Tax=Vagococcus allomyrinae TaxID=2794353 RepID=A0A940PF68_9ENTE|nr:hypothetical protein [Vagococcus allomyrinae]MBP1042411.1 hypothetical protein [Vagococcus allomyrinae]